MLARSLKPEDIPHLQKMYDEMGLGYELPDFMGPEFASVEVLADENDIPVMACASRKTVELYFLIDKRWRTPKWRWEGFKRLYVWVTSVLRQKSYTDMHAWLPPALEKSFGYRKLIQRLGWLRSEWPCFFKVFAKD